MFSERYKAICLLFWTILKNPVRCYILEFFVLLTQKKRTKKNRYKILDMFQLGIMNNSHIEKQLGLRIDFDKLLIFNISAGVLNRIFL